MITDDKTRILILGGGFGGVYTAKYLEKGLSRKERKTVEITLVNRENYLVLQHFLPQAISDTIKILNCIVPIRKMSPRTHLHTRRIEKINFDKKRVSLAPVFRPKPLYLSYDHLVIATGTLLDYSSVPGMREHAIPFKYLRDALHLRNHLVRVVEQADIESDTTERNRLLTFVVAGGGLPGVECIAEINDFLHAAVKSYKKVREEELRVVLLQNGERILPEMDERLAEYAQKILEKRGVVICLNAHLKAVTADSVVIHDNNIKRDVTFSTRTAVVTGPAAPYPILESLPCELEQGRIKTTNHLSIPEWPHHWALGDCAAVPQMDGITSPPTAQHALRQAEVCAHNILACIRNKKLKSFTFTGLGTLVSLGSRSAIAEVLGFKLSGIPAFLLWRLIFLLEFPGLDGKFRIFVDWMMDLFLPKNITQVSIFHNDSIVQEHFEQGQVINKQGDYAEKVYIIVQGEVEVILEGKEIAILQKGDVFGEMSLINDNPRCSDTRARTALDVIAVSRQSFHRLMTHMPGVRDAMESILDKRTGKHADLKKSIDEQ